MEKLKYLPAENDQGWLLQSLAALIRQCGYQQFVVQPIIEPTPRFFPEPRGTSLYVLDRASRRLMQYAGLGELNPEFQFFSRRLDQPGGRRKPTRCGTAVGMFLGIENSRCHFAINVQQSGDAEHLVGIMSHEVAHAFRVHHGLSASHAEDEEELLTDVTTIYLGFGIFATNSSFRYRSSLELRGSSSRTLMQTSSAGYLAPQSFSFLLAAQLTARQASFWARRAILKHLEPDQAAFTRAALHHLRDNKTFMNNPLGIPPPGAWTPPRPIEDMLRPLPEYSGPAPTTYSRPTPR